jgi:hypothetical protein
MVRGQPAEESVVLDRKPSYLFGFGDPVRRSSRTYVLGTLL